ncbi:hypothetical protein [Pseudomonas graminis]
MTELTHPTHVLPLPEDITTLASPQPAIILNSLNENAKHTLSEAFDFVRMAFTSLDEALNPFANEATPDEIFYLTPQELEADIPTTREIVCFFATKMKDPTGYLRLISA